MFETPMETASPSDTVDWSYLGLLENYSVSETLYLPPNCCI